MSRNYKFHNPDGVYFISIAVVEWLDVFTRSEYKTILIDPRWRGFANRALLCKNCSFIILIAMNKKQETVGFCPAGQGTNYKFAPVGDAGYIYHFLECPY